LKPYFFTSLKSPSLLDDYDVIGFGTDHCLVKYNVIELTETLVSASLIYLYEEFKGYPKEVITFNFDEHKEMCINGGVWDISNGTIIRLAEGCVVTHAIRGYNKLTIQEI
jgi:hypothetical protein